MLGGMAGPSLSPDVLAVVTSFAGTVLPEAIFRAKSRSASFEAMVRGVHSARMADTVADGLVDVGFGRITVTLPDVETTPLMHDRYAIVYREDRRLTEFTRPIRWDDLAGEEFIGNVSYDSHICDGLSRLRDNAQFHISSASSAFALVTAKVGFSAAAARKQDRPAAHQVPSPRRLGSLPRRRRLRKTWQEAFACRANADRHDPGSTG